MDCARAQELFSDHREAQLDGVLRADVDVHLSSCHGCRALMVALGEVMVTLRRIPDLEPPADLAARVAAAALAARPAQSRERWSFLIPTKHFARLSLPPRVLAAAAGLALATTALVLMTVGANAERWRTASNLVTNRASSTAAFMVERKDRLIEDLRFLRVVVGAAFEGRVERVNDRVDDYRRLLERRKTLEEEKTKSGASKRGEGIVRSARHTSFSLNRVSGLRVEPGERSDT